MMAASRCLEGLPDFSIGFGTAATKIGKKLCFGNRTARQGHVELSRRPPPRRVEGDLVERFRSSNHMLRHSGAPPHIVCCRCAHRIVPISGKPEIGCSEPGIHNPRSRDMDSGLATFGGAPE